MVDTNQILSIEDAQKLKYDNRDLTTDEKKLLEHDSLKEAGSTSPRLEALRKAAVLLEKAIQGRSATSFKQTLLDDLNRAKGGDLDDKAAYKAIDSKGYAQDAITKLMALKTKTPTPPNQNNETIDAEIAIRNKKADKIKAEIVVKENKRDELIGEQKIINAKFLASKQRTEKLKDLRTLLRKGTLGTNRPLYNISANFSAGYKYTDMNSVTQNTETSTDDYKKHPNYLLELIVESIINLSSHKQKFWNTGLSEYSNRGWINKTSIEYLNYQTFNVIKDIDETQFFAQLTHLSAAQKTEAKTIYDKLKTCRFLLNKERHTAEENGLELKPSSQGYNRFNTKISDRPDDIFPKKFFDHQEYRKFVEIVFGNWTAVQGTGLLDLKPTTDPNKKWNFEWYAYSDEPFTGPDYPDNKLYDIRKWFETKHPDKINELNLFTHEIENFRDVAKLTYNSLLNKGVTPNRIFNATEWNSVESSFTKQRRNLLYELQYIKTLRAFGITKEIISDHDLLKITGNSRCADLKLRKEKKSPEFQFPYLINKYKKTDVLYLNHALADTVVQITPKLMKLKINATGNERHNYNFYLDDTHLETVISNEELVTRQEEDNLKAHMNVSQKILEDIISLQQGLDDVNKEIAELEAAREKPDKPDEQTDLPKLKEDFKKKYGAGPSDTNKYTWTDVVIMQDILRRIKKLESPLVDQEIITAESELNTKVIDKTKDDHATIGEWESLNGSNKDKMDSISDKDALEKYRLAFENYGKIIKMKDSQIADQEALRKRIAGEDAPDTTPVQKLSDAEIKEALNTTVEPDASVYGAWKGFDKTESKLKTKDQIATFIKYIHDNKDKFYEHLKGLDPKDKPEGIDVDATTAINNFLAKKTPELVIKTIFDHKLEEDDYRKNIVKEFKDAKNSDKQKLDLDKYGDKKEPTEDGKNNRKGLVQFLYEKETGIGHNYLAKDNKKDDTPQEEKTPFWKRGYYAIFWAPVLVVVVAAAFFWQNITNWWNGPTEVEGGDNNVDGKVEQ